MSDNSSPLVVFQRDLNLGSGDRTQAALIAREALIASPELPILVFDRTTGRAVDLDLRGSAEEVSARYAPEHAPARRGRPKLGVTAREVTLLPRHWDWLAAQPGGASAALRRLVEAARKADEGQSGERMRRDAAYAFMSAMAGDRPGFEEASRALFAGDLPRLANLIAGWPKDIAAEVRAVLAGD